MSKCIYYFTSIYVCFILGLLFQCLKAYKYLKFAFFCGNFMLLLLLPFHLLFFVFATRALTLGWFLCCLGLTSLKVVAAAVFFLFQFFFFFFSNEVTFKIFWCAFTHGLFAFFSFYYEKLEENSFSFYFTYEDDDDVDDNNIKLQNY